MTAPAIGTFLRPVGHIGFCYCYRLDRVLEPHMCWWGPEERVWVCSRFDLDRENDEPVAKHVEDRHQITEPVLVAPGVWRARDEDPWDLDPLYWREMGQRGQLTLF
ncbi:hypothetical protein CDN99_06555 [Roseateles aquatilis]|uniref:Uncharacterized protein n=1 Tax=Roseateles aquatilis TaxID=431061 RepID=A0A246JHM2_9BURK|nr:hypothetical protein [Roseateles aquatilis]OWQ92013.1 hypothetical protein CDN99_06555 [Roseateles aquatilis]